MHEFLDHHDKKYIGNILKDLITPEPFLYCLK